MSQKSRRSTDAHTDRQRDRRAIKPGVGVWVSSGIIYDLKATMKQAEGLRHGLNSAEDTGVQDFWS